MAHATAMPSPQPVAHDAGSRLVDADEVGDESVGRLAVDLERRGRLPDAAVAHDHDHIGHGHGLALVVGDDDGGDAEPLLQLPQLHLHRLAQLGVQCRQRLVEQEQLRRQRQRAGDRDALALAARELARPGRSAKPGRSHQLQQFLDPLAPAPPCGTPRMRSG